MHNCSLSAGPSPSRIPDIITASGAFQVCTAAAAVYVGRLEGLLWTAVGDRAVFGGTIMRLGMFVAIFDLWALLIDGVPCVIE